MTVEERRERAEYLRRLRQPSHLARVSPADAWYTVKPRSKANETGAAELCRREIRWLEDLEYAEEQQRSAKRRPFSGLFGLSLDDA